jgi:hypothetical protein
MRKKVGVVDRYIYRPPINGGGHYKGVCLSSSPINRGSRPSTTASINPLTKACDISHLPPLIENEWTTLVNRALTKVGA